jgi:hypothetical protein
MSQPDIAEVFFVTPIRIGNPPSKTGERFPPAGPDSWPKLELLESGGIRIHYKNDSPADVAPGQIGSMIHRDRSATDEFLASSAPPEEATPVSPRKRG